MVPTSWRVREGSGAMALMPRCYAARTGLTVVRLVWASGGVRGCRGRHGAWAHTLSDTAG